ncbi:MAG: hypothetical protein HY718_20095, partial [Planctomycetes bacterium]|nr:hypothetical protein [Planctomycetota bacterium]
LAVQRWGRPRFTHDLDLTLLTGLGTETPYIHELLAEFSSRIPDAERFALVNRVLLLSSSEGIPIDIALGGMPFEERMVERATDFRYTKDALLCTCSGEDLVVLKAFADRPQDWVDIEGVLIRQQAALDRRYILENLGPLCELKESPEIVDKLVAMFDRFPPE